MIFTIIITAFLMQDGLTSPSNLIPRGWPFCSSNSIDDVQSCNKNPSSRTLWLSASYPLFLASDALFDHYSTTTTYSFASSHSGELVATLPVTIYLNAGSNTIRFSNSSSWAPDIDKITIAS